MTDDPGARLRSVERRLRREKKAVERLNPLEEPEAYAAGFTRVIDLEAERRALREALAVDQDADEDADQDADEDADPGADDDVDGLDG